MPDVCQGILSMQDYITRSMFGCLIHGEIIQRFAACSKATGKRGVYVPTFVPYLRHAGNAL